MKSVMLYFGSFNPIHLGHVTIAEYVLEKGLADELWFIVSPRNPLKDESLLIDERHRLEMVRTAINSSSYASRMRACDVEFNLPKPSYTVDTLRILGERFPDTEFSLIAGSDITGQIERWKDWEKVMAGHRVYVYPRRGYDVVRPERFTVLEDAPSLGHSSTDIRSRIYGGENIQAMLPAGVYEFIEENRLWKNTDVGPVPGAGDTALDGHMERGRNYFRAGEFGNALNEFLRAVELSPGNVEAQEFINMIYGILEFRNTDMYNP